MSISQLLTAFCFYTNNNKKSIFVVACVFDIIQANLVCVCMCVCVCVCVCVSMDV